MVADAESCDPGITRSWKIKRKGDVESSGYDFIKNRSIERASELREHAIIFNLNIHLTRSFFSGEIAANLVIQS